MPIYLEENAFNPNGPDGQGRNRLRFDTLDPQPRCALRPRSYATLRESQNTSLAKWNGNFDLCKGGGQCSACPRLKHQFALDAFTPDVMIRIDEQARLHAMDRPEDGWASYGRFVEWEDIAAVDGWRIGKHGADAHSPFFLLHREG